MGEQIEYERTFLYEDVAMDAAVSQRSCTWEVHMLPWA